MRVTVRDDYENIASSRPIWNDLERVDTTFHSDHCSDDDELVERLSYADVVVTVGGRTVLTSDLLERLPGVQLIVTTGDNEAVDIEAATELGITVCGTTPTVKQDGSTGLSEEDLDRHFAHAVAIIKAFRAGDALPSRN
jgi:lactate dehydrogenase-like 2-hydroxyacid dehydrogenase